MENLNDMDNLNDKDAAAGRGPGIDWTTERTFETGMSRSFKMCDLPHALTFSIFHVSIDLPTIRGGSYAIPR